MKRTRLIFLLLSLSLALCACTATEPEILFDEASQGLVSVILRDYNDGTIHYDTVGPDGLRQPTQPFESDPLEILTAADGCFETVGDENTGNFRNALILVSVLDENGQPAEVTESIRRIFELTAQNEQHEILKLRILRQGELYFATVELNVNIWLPHKLYFYDPAADALTELYTYDATQVIGLKVLNL